MKRFLVIFVLAIFVANFSFGLVRIKPAYTPVTQEDVLAYRIINHNASANGLANPNFVLPGWSLYYELPDGSDTVTNVAKGDNQTKVVKGIIKKKDLLNPKLPTIPELKDSDQEPVSFWKDFWNSVMKDLPWIIIILFILALLIWGINNKKFRDFMNRPLFPGKKDPKFSEDPTKEGKPFVADGVRNDNQADAHFVNLARNSNPGLNPSNIVIKERKRVYVSTPNGESAIVEFADGSKESLSFQNVPGWAAMVSTDGGKKFKREVFFQDCGNPVYGRTSMKDSGLIITDEPIKFGDEESKKVVEAMVELEKAALQKKLITEEKVEVKKVDDEEKQISTPGSETFQLQMKMMEIGEKAAEKGNLHSLVFDLKPDGSLKAAVNFKAPELHKEKKDEKTGTEGKDK